MLQQPSPAVHGSPGGLVGRLYAGQGYNERLTSSSPPRNTFFGPRVREEQYGGENAPSSVRGVSGLLRSRVNSAKERAFAQQQQQQQHQGQQQQYQEEGYSMIPRALEHASASRGPTSQRVDGINSPPRVALRRLSSDKVRPKASHKYGASASGSRESPGTGPTRDRKTVADHLPSVGGMALSHSLGALGCTGVSRATTPAAGDTQDDGAPYLKSEIISPNSLLKASRVSPRRSSLAVRSRRYDLLILLVLVLVLLFLLQLPRL